MDATKVSVQGCGRWGSFIAWYLNSIGKEVTLWGRPTSENLAELREKGSNQYLSMPASVRLIDDLAESVAHSDTIVISISSQELRSHARVLKPLLEGRPKKTITLCMKGLEDSSGKRLSQVIREELGDICNLAVWVGPGHVQDFIRGIPNCMVIDSEDISVKQELVAAFSSDLIRFYYGSDLLGTEIGAASKNVVGIAAGILDGLGLTALKGVLMARGAREISRLIKAMGGNELTAYGLAHLGDYEATVFSAFSQNRRFGEAFVKGEPFTSLAEGVATTRAMVRLSQVYDTDLPICQAVHGVVLEGWSVNETMAGLFARSIKGEFS